MMFSPLRVKQCFVELQVRLKKCVGSSEGLFAVDSEVVLLTMVIDLFWRNEEEAGGEVLEYTPGSSCCLPTLCSLFFFITIMVLLLLPHLVLSFINVYGYSSFHIYPVTYLSLLITRGHGYFFY